MWNNGGFPLLSYVSPGNQTICVMAPSPSAVIESGPTLQATKQAKHRQPYTRQVWCCRRPLHIWLGYSPAWFLARHGNHTAGRQTGNMILVQTANTRFAFVGLNQIAFFSATDTIRAFYSPLGTYGIAVGDEYVYILGPGSYRRIRRTQFNGTRPSKVAQLVFDQYLDGNRMGGIKLAKFALKFPVSKQ
jgi:hypothetical protein